MPQKMMDPQTTLVWVPKSGVVDPYNPTAVELNAGTNVSAAVVRGFTLNPTSSDTDTTASITDEGNVENPTYDNYEGSITFFRDQNITDNTSAYNKAWALFRKKGANGFWYRRVGFKSTVIFAIGHEVEGFLFVSDNAQTVSGSDGGAPIQFTVPFFQQGLYTGPVYVGPVPAPTITTVTGSPLQAGGQTLSAVGTNFYGVTQILFGGIPVSNIYVLSPTSLQFTSPPSTAGAKTSIVTAAGGASAAGGSVTVV